MENLWLDVADRVKDLSSKPEKFLEPSDTIFNKTKILAKVLYDAAKLLEDGKYKNVTLPELIIDNFDEEQVWAGVELQNTAWESDFRDQLEKLETFSIRNPDSFNLLRGPSTNDLKSKPVEEVESEEEDEDFVFDDDDGGEEEDEEIHDQESEGDDDLSDIEDGRLANGDNEDGDSDEDPEMKAILNDPDFQHMSDSDGDELPLFGEKDSSDDEEPDLEEEEEKEMKKQEEKEKKEKILTAKADAYLQDALKTIKTTAKGERAQVEDRFFKLDEMEKFLEAEEARERQDIKLELKGKNKKEAEEDSDDEDEDDDEMDLFDSRLVTEGKEDRAMYNDFFNEQSASEEEMNEDDDGDDGAAAGPPAKRMLLDADSSDDDEEDKDMGEIKSSFEVRTAKLKKEIKKMEEEAISDKKPWQMIGEVSAVTRPENSLLQEHLDYDNVAKQAPIVTEEVSRRLEDIIMQRIKDRAWDDVERKIRPIENPYEYKKKLILDQEKSKLSLAEVYEQEYLKQKGDVENAKKVPGMLDPEEDGPPPEVDAIKRSMKSLFAKLDTLTHFHYTPRMASAEVKIVRNAPAITMEEVAPIAMNDANLLAPQEIVDKKRSEEIGVTEKTETDKKRERRQKKQKQRLREKEKEKKEKLLEKLNPGLGNKHSKKKVLKDIEKAEKEGKLVTIKSKSKSVKSSSAFFNQLQNETMSTLKEKMSQAPKKKKSEKGLSGALLKL